MAGQAPAAAQAQGRPRPRAGFQQGSPLKVTAIKVVGSVRPESVKPGEEVIIQWTVTNNTILPRRCQVVIEHKDPSGNVSVLTSPKEIVRGRSAVSNELRFKMETAGESVFTLRLMLAPPILLTFEQEHVSFKLNVGGGSPTQRPASSEEPRHSGIVVVTSIAARTPTTQASQGLVPAGGGAVQDPGSGIVISNGRRC